MPEQDPLSAEEAELHQVLRRFIPRPPGFNLAGIALAAQQRQRRQVWRWRGAAALLAAGLIVMLLLRTQPRTVERVVYVPQPQPAITPPPGGLVQVTPIKLFDALDCGFLLTRGGLDDTQGTSFSLRLTQ